MKDAGYKIPGFQASANPEAGHTRVSDFSQLIKTRLTFLVLITTGVGFYLGSSDPVDVVRLLNVLFGAALAAAGASALNQWWERDLDALMLRTRMRPVPSGRMRPGSALILGCLFAVIPSFIGMANSIYLLIEIILSGLFTAVAMRFHRLASIHSARLLFFSSIIYLPLLLAALMLTKL